MQFLYVPLEQKWKKASFVRLKNDMILNSILYLVKLFEFKEMIKVFCKNI